MASNRRIIDYKIIQNVTLGGLGDSIREQILEGFQLLNKMGVQYDEGSGYYYCEMVKPEPTQAEARRDEELRHRNLTEHMEVTTTAVRPVLRHRDEDGVVRHRDEDGPTNPAEDEDALNSIRLRNIGINDGDVPSEFEGDASVDAEPF